MTAIRIFEVGPRDGLQSIKRTVPTSTKLDLITRLVEAGLKNVEITSVVSPRAVPQLADCRQVLSSSSVQAVQRMKDGPRLSCLVPNKKGLEIAIENGSEEVAVFVSATEAFSRANTNCSVEESLQRVTDVAARALESGLAVRGQVTKAPLPFSTKRKTK